MNVYRSLLFSLGLLVAIAQAHAAAFIVRDIQVEGLQRISAGTVFNYLPVQVGSTISEKDYPDIIRALFKTGFFTDVNLERKGEVLVITVTERPGMAQWRERLFAMMSRNATPAGNYFQLPLDQTVDLGVHVEL